MKQCMISSKPIEHSVGECFEIDHVVYRICDGDSCCGCSLCIEDENVCLDFHRRFELCNGEYRKDGKDVIFVQVS